MIELISSERCIDCDRCVEACPRDVFDSTDQGMPVIARKADCQTCFLCELYCPVDALYVAPHVEEDIVVDEVQLVEQDIMGSFVRNMGWRKGRMGGSDQDPTRLLRIMRVGG